MPNSENILLVMPFGSLERPSIAAAMIKADIMRYGRSCEVLYASLDFAEEIGIPIYDCLSRRLPVTDLAGEWIFAKAAFGEDSNADRYFDGFLVHEAGSIGMLHYFFQKDNLEDLEKALDELRVTAENFISRYAEKIVAMNPKVVGATSVFQQNMASIAVLRKIKDLNPNIKTVIGGANCEAEMGRALEKVCPWIDVVHTGRSEGYVKDIFEIEGDYVHNDLISTFPNLEDYFERYEICKFKEYIKPSIPIEMSTGCWYGDKKHCTFCGLNGSTMRYKHRDADEVYEEFAYHRKKYNTPKFMAVDNILALDYFNTLLPRIVETKLDVDVFIEVKANLKVPQLKILNDAGFKWLQPGVESLHNDKLKRFLKGTDQKTNISLLKQALQLGMVVSWLILVNEPGEKAQEYQDMADLMPKLHHLMPPTTVCRIRFDRFSPLQTKSAEFGLSLDPYKSYTLLYPEHADLHNLAYYLEDYDYERVEPDTPEMQNLNSQHLQWAQAFYGLSSGQSPTDQTAHCVLELDRLARRITDTRQPNDPKIHAVTEEDIAILDALDEGMPKTQFPGKFPDFDMADFLDKGLVIDTGGHYLSLVMDPPLQPLPAFNEFPCGVVLSA